MSSRRTDRPEVAVSSFRDPSPNYWQEYGPFQQVKHELIRAYLQAWFPILASWARRVLYIDTHAGRGSYDSQQAGSPLVALRTLLEHDSLDRLLSSSEFRFTFIERDAKNEAALRRELKVLSWPDDRVFVKTVKADAFATLRGIIETIKQSGGKLAPAFVFVDPYGFKLPGDLLADLMAAGRVELFVNVMWRELDMAIRQRPKAGRGHAPNLDSLFGRDAWRGIDADSMSRRSDQAASLLAKRVDAKWWTHIRMVTGGRAVRCFLLHLTNHDRGRERMKESVWKVDPAGTASVRRSDHPEQFYLLGSADEETRRWVLGRLDSGPKAHETLKEDLRATLWLPRHLSQAVRDLVDSGRVVRRDGLLSRNPQLLIP